MPASSEDARKQRFPVAAQLPRELQELCAHYLLAAAVRDLIDPSQRGRGTVDTSRLVAGVVSEPLWAREVVEALGRLLIAAGRLEQELGVRCTLIGRGEGDPVAARAMVDLVRDEIDSPATKDDDDTLRGYALLHQFAERHDLFSEPVESVPDPDADAQRRETLLPQMLWPGLRALATMTSAWQSPGCTPWMWLARLTGGSAAEGFAERDEDDSEAAEEGTSLRIADASKAHLLLRVALLHPDLLESLSAIDDRLPRVDLDVISGPLHHLVLTTLAGFGAIPVDAVRRGRASPVVVEIADALWPILRAGESIDIDHDDVDWVDDLHAALEDLLSVTSPVESGEATRRVLIFLSHVAAVDADETARVARELLDEPAMGACVLVDEDDEDVNPRLRISLLADGCAAGIEVAARIAADLPELTSDDPREESGLRNRADGWWNNIIRWASATEARKTISRAAKICGSCEPGGSMLTVLANPAGGDHELTTAMSTEQLVTGLSQVLASLTRVTGDPEFPHEMME